MSQQGEMGSEHLLSTLLDEYGDALRSVVEYRPSGSRIHYLRGDIDRDAASGRLVRIEQLYQAERLNNNPITHDPNLDRLHVSVFLFDGAIVVHMVDRGGAVVGFSLDPGTHLELPAVGGYYEDAFGSVPPSLESLR